MRRPSKAYLPLFALALLLIGTGCDSSSVTEDDQPTLIAPAAFSLDADFPENGAAGKTSTKAHFLNAAGRVGIVSLAVGANLVVPAAITDAATDADPVVEDGTWTWSTTARVEGDDVTFRLEGTPDGREIDWRMRILSAPEADSLPEDFVLYTATTSLDGSSGNWNLYYDLDGTRTEVLNAEFDVTSATEKEITYRVPDGLDVGGSSVRYQRQGDARLFDWLEQPSNERTLIEWNAETHAGSIEADDYNDGARACWNEDLDDVACSAS